MSEQMKTPRKWTKVLLIVSLALNACFIGLIIGVKLTQDRMRPQRTGRALRAHAVLGQFHANDQANETGVQRKGYN